MYSPGSSIPSSYCIGDEINWEAPWVDVSLWIELPFWLMTGDTTTRIGVDGHDFEIAIHEDYYELHVGEIADSKQNVCYSGPRRSFDQLSCALQEFIESCTNTPLMWRKCKTVLKIASRCNQHVWKTATEEERPFPAAFGYYLADLCRAHIPVVNKLIQQYRLATYDYFPYEVSPWDVPHWLLESNGHATRATLVPYKDWDGKPRGFTEPLGELIARARKGQPLPQPNAPYKLIENGELQGKMSIAASPGEFDLLDALNLMERGDYSGAVRRVTTAIEAIVEGVVARIVEAREGKRGAVKFLKDTETNFPYRVSRYEELGGRALPDALRSELKATRKLRHRIVHKGYRIGPNERGRAQKCVDTGRWTYNWFENNQDRIQIREKKIAFRSLGRDRAAGIFPTKITSDGVVVSPIHQHP